MDKVTILMATYNGSKYLEEQLNSIIKQDYTNWKLIVSDDHSTDETIEILQKYCLLYTSLRSTAKPQ